MTTGNRFSALDSDWSSVVSQSIAPYRSQFTFTATNPCDSSPHSASLSPYLSSILVTPPSPSRPIVKLPGSDSYNAPRRIKQGLESRYRPKTDSSTMPYNPFILPPIPSPFLYKNESRELLLGIDDRDPLSANSFGGSCCQGWLDPDFTNHNLQVLPLTTDNCEVTADDDLSQPMLSKERLSIGAALPNMSKAVPARTMDFDFYKHTRSYLPHFNRAGGRSDVASVTVPRAAGETASEPGSSKPIITTFPRWLQTMPGAFPRPKLPNLPLAPSSAASVEPASSLDKPGLWEPATAPRMQPQTSMYGLNFPKLTPAMGCSSPLSSRCRKPIDGYVKRMASLWDSSGAIRLQKTGLRPPDTSPKPSNHTAAFDTNLAMAAFEQTMNKDDTTQTITQTPEGLWNPPDGLPPACDSPLSLSTSASQIPPNRRHTSPIRDAARRSAMNPRTLSESAKTIDTRACSASVCKPLVPAKLYEQQYLGWPRRMNGEDVPYNEKAWSTIGAYVARLQKEKAGRSMIDLPVESHEHEFLPTSGENVASRDVTWLEEEADVVLSQKDKTDAGLKTGSDVKLETELEKTVELATEDLVINKNCVQDCCQADTIHAGSKYDLCDPSEELLKMDSSTKSPREHFVHGAVAGDDVPLQFFNEIVKTPDSDVDWSEIGTEFESEGDWDWSDDEIGA